MGRLLWTKAGKYSNYGPDYEGQVRRLRLSDGVFFTKYGAVKLARYVEHELRRFMNNRVPVALPSGPLSRHHPRQNRPSWPLVGPVVPLTGPPKDKDTKDTKDGDDLLRGRAAARFTAMRPLRRFLQRAKRWPLRPVEADNFSWTSANNSPAAQSAPVPPVAAETAVPPAGAGAMASAPPRRHRKSARKG